MIFVTGATGFLGHHLIPTLIKAGHSVRVLARATSPVAFLKQYPQVELAPGDLLDRESLIEGMKGCEYVVHAGGLFRLWGEQKWFEEVNVQGTAHILEAALRVGVQRFVHVSSVAVIGAPVDNSVIDEKYTCKPDDFYQRSKYDAENMVRMFAVSTRFPAIILRPGAYYGPWGHYAWNRLFFEDPMRGLRIRVHQGNRLTFPVFVPDVAQSVVAALTRGRLGEIYNISGDPITHNAANQIISKLIGISAWRLNCPAGLMLWLARQMARIAEETHREPYYPLALAKYVFCDWNVSSQKARDELGWSPTPFEEGARQTVEWYQANGWGTRKKR
jgi:nucleoside-diphosphate-sugar epimerase